MAPSEDAAADTDNKKCKYCKSNVDKAGVKCNSCKIVYHQSCALRISGLIVLSGCKALILCAACGVAAKKEEVNKAVCEATLAKNEEIMALKAQLSQHNQGTQLDIAEMYKKIHGEITAMEKNLVKKMESLYKATPDGNIYIPVPAPANRDGPYTNPTTPTPETNNDIGIKISQKSAVAAPVAPVEIRATRKSSLSKDIPTRVKENAVNVNKINAKSVNDQAGFAGTPKQQRTENQPDQQNEQTADKNGTWETVRRKRRLPEQPRPKPIQGCNENSRLKGVEKQSFLFVSGLNREVTSNDLKSFITDTFNCQCICEKMKTRKDKHKSSYKVQVPFNARERVMAADMWGKGISINHFLHIRRRPYVWENRVDT